MEKKIIIITIAILAFTLAGLKLSFCRAVTKEGGATVEEERKQILEYSRKGDIESAIKLGEEYIKKDPDNIEILVTLTECYIGAANFDKAEASVKKAVSVDPKNTWAIKTLAKTYRAEAEQAKSTAEKKKLLDLAQVEIGKALKVQPEDAWINTEAALIYLLQGRKDDANKAIKKAVSAQPNDTYIKDIKTRINATP